MDLVIHNTKEEYDLGLGEDILPETMTLCHSILSIMNSIFGCVDFQYDNTGHGISSKAMDSL